MFKQEKFRPETATEAARRQAHAAADAAIAQATALRDKAGPLAGAAADRTAAAAANARQWASPRLEKARDLGVEKAAPRVEQAARALGPKVDEMHDRIIDDVLPKVVAAVTAAADAAAERTHDIQKAGLAQLAEVEKSAKAARKRSRRPGRFVVIFAGLGAMAGAGWIGWKKMNGPTEDPWASAATTAPVTPPVTPAPKPTGGSTPAAEPVTEPVTESSTESPEAGTQTGATDEEVTVDEIGEVSPVADDTSSDKPEDRS